MIIKLLLAAQLAGSLHMDPEIPDKTALAREIVAPLENAPSVLKDVANDVAESMDCRAIHFHYTTDNIFGHMLRFKCIGSLESPVVVVWTRNLISVEFVTFPD